MPSEKRLNQLNHRAMRILTPEEVKARKKPKKLSNKQLRALKRRALAVPNPFRRAAPHPLATAIHQQNQLTIHQARVKARQTARSDAGTA